MASTSSHSSDESPVRHLVELGYVDPVEVAARDSAMRRQLEAELQQAIRLSDQGLAEDPIHLLERLVADDPDWARPHQLLVELHFRAGRLAVAEDHLRWLQHHGVEHPRFALIEGALALARRQLKAALEAAEYVCHVEPELPGVFTLLGAVRFRLGQHDRAMEAFERALQQNPRDARALDGMAAACLCRGEYERAAELALEALERDMQLYRAHYHLGVALAHMDRPQEATAALEAAGRIAPNAAAPFYWLARIAETQIGDASRAKEYRERARAAIGQRRTPS